MKRRAFLSTLVGGVAATAAARTWPFRVFSFPTDIKPVPRFLSYSVTVSIDKNLLDANAKRLVEKMNDISKKYFDEVIANAIFSPSPTALALKSTGRPYNPFRDRYPTD